MYTPLFLNQNFKMRHLSFMLSHFLYKILESLSACRIWVTHQCKKIPTSSHFQRVLLNYLPPPAHSWNLKVSYVNISKRESIKTWKWALQGGEAAGLRGGRVSGTGEGGRWSSWWDWSPGSNSLRRQDWSKRRNVLTGTDVKCPNEEISQTGVQPPPLLFLIYSSYAHYFDGDLINTISRIRRMCVRCRSDALTLVKVELLVGRAVP